MIHNHEASDDYEWVMIVLAGKGAQHHLMLHHGASGIALQSATKTTVKTIRIMNSVERSSYCVIASANASNCSTLTIW